ncbi:MAG: hypothetical protein JRE16_07005 [Deltaproteobacteria bacterium]|jgi:hypothetical protein|nr:hypothetical protein [Deltaproteobacteria bacterium]MBW2504304.1 hypothetical protein [Deltaproteobacteria bacterium]MBW2520819.1 hypothetical protein [Deltaproteobacteria bacterium]
MTILKGNQKIVWSIVITLLLFLSLIPDSRKMLFEDHLFKVVDSTANHYVEEGLVRAAAAFATARTFNAIVSVFQESQLQLEPGGVGVSLALGAALDPANDLVERFSWIMLVSLTSLGIQKLLIEITPFVSIQILLTLSLVILLAGLWSPRSMRQNVIQIGRVLLFSALLIRFAVPAIAYLNQQIYVAFLEEQHNQSIQALGQTVTDLEKHQITDLGDSSAGTQPRESADYEGWWDSLKAKVSDTVDQGKRTLDIASRLDAVKQAALKIIDRIIDLIVVFVISTIVLPLLFLWGIIKFGSLVINRGIHLFPTNQKHE